jgi:hypothetical protein
LRGRSGLLPAATSDTADKAHVNILLRYTIKCDANYTPLTL